MKFNGSYGNNSKLLILVLFIVLLIIGQVYENFYLKSYRMMVAGIGVFAILFACEFISNYFFGKGERSRERWKEYVCQLICYVSHASMVCYMFHRLFFWAGEKLYSPDVEYIKWGYMASVVFPIMLYLSYLIQKHYDALVNRIKLS